jgi:integral membrane sensor domain MASE1
MVLWWLANVVALLVVVPLVLFLANRIMREGAEINAYADDILAHGVGLSANLIPVPALVETAQLVGVAKGHAVRYVVALDRLTD